MRILHICTTQYTDGWMYQENLLTKYHKKLGHDIWVITSQYCYYNGRLVIDKSYRFEDCNGIKIIRLASKKNNLSKKLIRLKNFYKTVEAISPDLIFSHGCQYLDIKEIIKYVQKNKKCELRIDNHADFCNSATNYISRFVLHGMIWKYYAQKIDPYVSKWFGVSPARVDFLEKMYCISRDKIELLVMGADDELVSLALEPEMKLKIRKEYGIGDQDFLIISGGKITNSKRKVIDLMHVINRLNRNDVKLIIFGSIIPELKPEILRLCSDKVKYIGWVDSTETTNYFAAADLVVFPGLHSVFWEQVIALGIPMVCSQLYGMEHIDFGGNIGYLNNGGEEEIYNVICNILENGNYIKMKCVAKAFGFQKFSYSAIAKKSLG